jgi:hypothetical protein
MRPNGIAPPPGVQANRPATAKLAANSSATLMTSAKAPCISPANGTMPRRTTAMTKPAASNAISTASVAVWVAAENAIRAISAQRSQRASVLPRSVTR